MTALAIEPPVLEEKLLDLSSRGRLIAGGLMVPFGVLASVWFWERGLIWFGALFCVLFGVVLAGSALRDEARECRFDAEVARAQGEWGDLQRDLALCTRSKGNAARLLQQRGYREFAVRRWIVRELGG